MERSSYVRGWHIIMALLLALLPCLGRSQTVEYIHSDSQGSLVAITNDAGQVIERTDYAPYGGVLGKPNSDRPGYTGHVMDSATGLVHMQQRYYDPTIGRFLSTDPVQADPNTGNLFNRYWYANNNPYRFIDPDGRQSVQEQIDSGAQGCGRITCAGWAALNATWKVLGAEGLSKSYDRGWSGSGSGDKASAGLEVLSAFPVVKAARALTLVKELPAALKGGEAATHVYLGMRDGKAVYVGITNDIARRQAEHGARFALQPLTTSPVTRGEARSIEQAIKSENPQFENVRNSFSPRHEYYQQAVDWGKNWLKSNGY